MNPWKPALMLVLGLALWPSAAHSAPLDDVNQYADRCAAELGAGAGAYMPMGILPQPDNFSDSREIPVFWNQKRITFEETDAATGAPRGGSGHWEFLFDGLPGAAAFPDGANTVGRIRDTNRFDLKCDYWSHVQSQVFACLGGTRNDGACDCPDGACNAATGRCVGGSFAGERCAPARNCAGGGTCKALPTGCFPGQRALQRDVGTCRNAGPAFDRKACSDDTQCGNVAGACQDIVSWSMVFRRLKPPRLGQAAFDQSHPYYFNNFDVVAFKPDTAGTCWFDTLEINGLTTDGWWKDAAGVPAGIARPGGKDTVKKTRAQGFWETPDQVRYQTDPGKGDKRCTSCHGNGPILTSRWINQGPNAANFGQLFAGRVGRSIPYWHPAKLLPNPTFKRTQCGDSCHNAWSTSATTMPGNSLAEAMTTEPFAELASFHRRQIDNAGAALAKTCRGRTVKEGQPCNADPDCGGAPGVCTAGQNAGILFEMPHRFTGTPAQWTTDVKPSYEAMKPCRRLCAGGVRPGRVCAEDAECPGDAAAGTPAGTCAPVAAACGATVQATIPFFFGAQFTGAPAPPSQFIEPPYPAANVKFARANCVLAADGSETCTGRTEWDDPNPADPESAYHAADKYYLVTNQVENKAGETPRTLRFCGENIEATPTTAPLGTSNWAKKYTSTNALAACRKTELRLCGGYFIDSAPDANDAHSPTDSRNDGDAQRATLVTACANAMKAARSGFRLHRATGRYVQTVTLKNDGTTAITGPITYLLFNLSANATLFAATGTTAAIVPTGTPYKNAALTSNTLGAGQSVTLTLEFVNPTNKAITYDARMRTGAGEP